MFPSIVLTDYATAMIARRGIPRGLIEYALEHRGHEYRKGHDVIITCTLPDERLIKVRRKAKSDNPWIIVDVFIVG